MTRYVVSAIAAILTLFATLFGLSKAIEPVTSGVLLIIGHFDLSSPSQSQTPDDDSWCRQEPNETLLLAEAFRGLCDAEDADCGPDCVRVSTSEWSSDCRSHSSIRVCIPSNPMLRATGPSG